MPSLKLAESSSTKHKEVVTGVDWSAANELLSVSDDKTVWLWNIDGCLLYTSPSPRDRG